MNYVKIAQHAAMLCTWWCLACGTYKGEYRGVAQAHHEAADHARHCPAIAIAVERDKLARRAQRLQTALDRLTAATILPDMPPC